MSDLSSNILLPAETHIVTSVRGGGAGVESIVDVSDDVYNNMAQNPDSTVCLRTQTNGPWGEASCLDTWGWQLHNCTDMLPFKLDGVDVLGQFLQVSNEARGRGISVGTNYRIECFPNSCEYAVHFTGCQSERGQLSYSRASDYSLTNGGGGNYRYANLTFFSSDGQVWSAFMIANNRFQGTMETLYGIVTFNIVKRSSVEDLLQL